MADTSADNAGASFDLSQFHQVFFEEAGENLERMEQQLLEIDIESADDETLNSIFRCAHSVKGGAATFGFSDVAGLTHQMETLLDKLRRHELEPNAAMVDVLLQSGDALKAQLALHQSGGKGDPVDTTGLLASYAAFISGGQPTHAAPAAMAPAPAPAAPASDAPPKGQRALELLVGPLDNPADADQLVELFAEIVDLGTIEPLDGGQAADGMRRFKVITGSADDDLLDLFTFHVAREKVKLLPLGPGFGFHAGAPGAPPEETKPAEPVDNSFGFFDDAPGAPGSTIAAAPAHTGPPPGQPERRAVPRPAAAPAAEASTLRVSVEKVDQLINLVGELVITQAMLAQTSTKIDLGQHQQLVSGLADLQRHTRDLQESVMSIRMMPISFVFSRFPRVVRDLAGKLEKQVELKTVGEGTELDKGLIEKIADPLTHLVRNSLDHGVELPQKRLAAGKPATGTITLRAFHQGGNIVIEVGDDGAGLNREKIMAKARERGLAVSDTMSDQEVWLLIFEAGFSTADVVTAVSGRGVGMDVVKRNVHAMGGRVEIESALGVGTRISIRLPLTLAILDGMSVSVGQEIFIVPLTFITESLQPAKEDIRTIAGGGTVVHVRGDFLPVVALHEVLNIKSKVTDFEHGIMVIVESEGSKSAMFVDNLLGQHQVVIKSLESNYRKVPGVSGATIMGDGKVALILDVDALVRTASFDEAKSAV